MLTRGLAIVLAALAAVTPAASENWPQWRGPRANGVSGETGLPRAWGAEKNVAWRAPVEGLGTSTPIVWDDLVFVTSQTGYGPLDRRGAEFDDAVPARSYEGSASGVDFIVQAVSARDGATAWRYAIRAEEPADALPSVHPKHNLASPSVVTDGERVFAWMGTGQLVALTLQGEPQWERHLGREFGSFDVLWGHGSSPALHDGTLFLLVDHPGRAYLLALDAASGETLWKRDRPSGIRSYTTPLVIDGPAGDELIVNSSHRIESYDPDSGELVWHAGGPVTLAIGVPVLGEGVLYASRGYSSGPYSAIRLGGRGDVNPTHVEWHVPTRAPYISSLLLYRDVLFMATERGIASAVDSGTGKTLWRERLGGSFTASPVAGDGHVYLTNESGTTFVLEAEAPFAVVQENALGERTLASPAISGGTLFMRSDAHVVAIR